MSRPRGNHPTGFDPGYSLSGDGSGTVTSAPTAAPVDTDDWDWILVEQGLDPERYTVVPPVQVRAWDAAIGDGEVQRMHYYKANVVLRASQQSSARLDDLLAFVADERKPRKRPPAGAETFVVIVADLQLGKADGDGTAGTVARFYHMIDEVITRAEVLRAQGITLDECVLGWLGDIVENVDGFYAQQTFTVDLSLTEQVELGITLHVALNIALAPYFRRIVNVSVPGNHGEVRKDGKSHTNFADNFDTMLARQAHARLVANDGAFGHIELVQPHGEELTVTLDIKGHVNLFMHGHQGRQGGPVAIGKIVNWLAKQALAQRAPGEAEYVWSGHYHHLSVHSPGPRLLIQVPALDGGSLWHAETNGGDSPPGTVTAVIGPAPGLYGGWHDFHVIPADPMPPQWLPGGTQMTRGNE